jgi:hypothetical protein
VSRELLGKLREQPLSFELLEQCIHLGMLGFDWPLQGQSGHLDFDVTHLP